MVARSKMMDLRKLYSALYENKTYKMSLRRLASIAPVVRGIAPAPATLLDVGCGRGELIDYMTSYVCSGAEIVPSLCMRDDVKLIDTVAKLPYSDGEFDVVVCSDVLEHIDPAETEAALYELRRVARRALVIHVAWFPHVMNEVDLHINKRGMIEWLDLWDKIVRWKRHSTSVFGSRRMLLWGKA